MTDEHFKILIVEDSPTQAMKLQMILENLGYETMVAQNGIEGLNLLEKTLFPIVITDWVMPEMDGFEFCRAIRGLNLASYVYIFLLTSKDRKTDTIAGLEAGADDYLIKPPDAAELAARLKTAKRILRLEHNLRKRNEEIALLSITDPLTKIYNRRYLNDYLPGEIKHAIRYNHPISIIICDIDHFKNVNDQFGHQAGDTVLEKIAGCFKPFIRDGLDWVARYGGEEFLIVLPETALEGAQKAAERIRLLIAGTPVLFGSQAVTVTASFGAASISPSEVNQKVSPESLIAAADECLYRAKKEGRNRSFGVLIG